MTGPTTGRTVLDKDLDKLSYAEEATRYLARSRAAVAWGCAFLVGVFATSAIVLSGHPSWLLLTVAVALGGYMALNIGANDVANTMGPAVGARALTMAGALAIAAVFEGAGAILVGERVVATISVRLLDPAAFDAPQAFAMSMLAALVAAAVWINIATLIGAPVSTTHAVVGGVIGAGIGSAGIAALSEATVLAVVLSWLVTPLAGGLTAALLLAGITRGIKRRADPLAAARRWVPVMFAAMAATFTLYVLTIAPPPADIPSLGVLVSATGAVALAAGVATRFALARIGASQPPETGSLRGLFRVPLIGAAAILSFAHGANDVANAVGPVAAIFSALGTADGDAPLDVGLAVLVVAALGISLGVLLFGPRLVRMVGERITRLNELRGFCVVLATAIVVLAASAFGLPVSSTHIAVGAVFGVGFYREWSSNRGRLRAMLDLGQNGPQRDIEAPDLRRRLLVRRAHVLTIVAAWGVTVPASAAIAGAAHVLVTRLFG